jgi:hypothetical protein
MCAIVSFLLGVVGWFAAGLVGKPWLDFLNLRSQVHEEIIFTGNIGPGPGYDKAAYDKAQESLRRLAAKMNSTNATAATNITALRLLRWYLSRNGYDLAKAADGLMGLCNSLADDPSDFLRARYTNSIQMGLNLPRDRNDESLRLLKETWDRRHGVRNS